MPYYVQKVSIEWNYDQATPEQQAFIQTANKQLDSQFHTLDTFRDNLEQVVGQRRDLSFDALVEDGFRCFQLFRVAKGKIRELEVAECPEDALEAFGELPLDDVAEVRLVRNADSVSRALSEAADDSDEVELDGAGLRLPLAYLDEEGMRAALQLVVDAIDAPSIPFVASAEGARFLVELSPRSARVARLKVATEPELVERLLARRFSEVPEPKLTGNDKVDQKLYFADEQLSWIKEQAARADRSLSYVAQFAWKNARGQIAEATAAADLPGPAADGDKRAQTLFFPGATLQEIRDEAARLDTSLSRVVQCAVHLAQAAIEALPTAE